MYKMVAIDLDGTLLNSYGEVSKENKEKIKDAINKNIEIVIASGRMPLSIKPICEELGANNYIIAGNGTMVYDTKKDEIIYDKFLEKEKVLDIIKICEENSIYYNIYTDKSIIAKSLNYNVLYYHYENSKRIPEKRTTINIVENMYKYIDEVNTSPILKITICDNDKIIFNRILENKLKKILGVEVLDVAHMSRKVIKQGTEEYNITYFYTEISKKDANKWNAIEFLINKLGISKDEVVAIGDNVNDKEMVENAGLGIAMGGSYLEANKIGDVFVSDNNSNGVAEGFEKYILK